MAGGRFSMKTKRKEPYDVSDDFSDFSLSSPAPKIRRLDGVLPPIIEREEVKIHPSVVEEQLPPPPPPVIEELPPSENQDKAIVLFKPVNAFPVESSPNYSVNLDPDVISGFKNQFLWSTHAAVRKLSEKEAATESDVTNHCKAVVPWVPSQIPAAQGMDVVELMEAEGTGEEAMEIEADSSESMVQGLIDEFGGMRGNDGLLQRRQQHCMIPHIPPSTSDPITWLQ